MAKVTVKLGKNEIYTLVGLNVVQWMSEKTEPNLVWLSNVRISDVRLVNLTGDQTEHSDFGIFTKLDHNTYKKIIYKIL